MMDTKKLEAYVSEHFDKELLPSLMGTVLPL